MSCDQGGPITKVWPKRLERELVQDVGVRVDDRVIAELPHLVRLAIDQHVVLGVRERGS
jgi:hypothetical protein